MNQIKGPKLNFSTPIKIQDFIEEKPYSVFDFENTDCFKNEKISKQVKFAPTITIFLRYQDEEINRFRDRLKTQVQMTKETYNLNPTLEESPKKQQLKSCMRVPIDTDY
ncbi:unnamed protein product (macronuclear) [Paramecium tetraurelia]|uniref:Uncharacterized protein n=1 Tax=Paramecium tetraurelia TaxID=5888 RepID=A0D575_PARTE|nr:uncharacterized protein GSPATT00013639001 [Paramecium tetraurelia]CAK78192.1 unnamed protein product [Paramecium tetraurelia]|eukprot:XP_001445589.1 hypothetical protein (macronuclear) [Paramecium tetraurelia strain d4-2]